MSILRVCSILFCIGSVLASATTILLTLDYIIYSTARHKFQWERFYITETSDIYLDINEVRIIRGLTRHKILLDFHEQVAPASSQLFTVDTDCKRKLRRILEIGPAYSGQMGTGTQLVAAAIPSGALQSVKELNSYSDISSLTSEEYIIC